ncbi:MAG: hypothetical protein LAT77_00230 [Aliidiomarina sp.]|uniref:DNA polymerase III subunit delta' n=1 Tax=Aliidiomarina sp. TaxID=1872439 RepID=UPI0025B80D91|nr:DNA polymerase III subunit delta' [Aliidiomarina sp.]MCH8500316.1 hypothetical protein [Aliidiomarina sp.]
MTTEQFPQGSFPWLRRLWLQLLTSFKQQRLAHGLGFSDAAELGSEVLRLRLEQFLLCEQNQIRNQACGECKSCKLYLAGTHPDLIVLQPEGQKQIGVDAVRQAVQQVQKTAGQGGNKVISILSADQMSLQAANALLKTLEEPPQATYFCLYAKQYSQLLPTIRSRIASYPLPRPSVDELNDWLTPLSQIPLSPDQLERAQRQPLSVLAELQTGQIAEDKELKGLLRGQLPTSSDPIELQSWLERVLASLQQVCRDAAENKVHPLFAAVAPANISAQRCYEIANASYRRALEIRQQARQSGINLPLLLQAWNSELMLQIYRKV